MCIYICLSLYIYMYIYIYLRPKISISRHWGDPTFNFRLNSWTATYYFPRPSTYLLEFPCWHGRLFMLVFKVSRPVVQPWIRSHCGDLGLSVYQEHQESGASCKLRLLHLIKPIKAEQAATISVRSLVRLAISRVVTVASAFFSNEPTVALPQGSSVMSCRKFFEDQAFSGLRRNRKGSWISSDDNSKATQVTCLTRMKEEYTRIRAYQCSHIRIEEDKNGLNQLENWESWAENRGRLPSRLR